MKKYYLFGGIGGATVISIAVAYILMATNPTVPQTDDALLDNMSEALNFTYTDANTNLKEALATEGISMSSPVRLKEKTDIDKYCTFFKDKEKQSLVEYCTSTELRDSDGEFLGNIHMIGSPSFPRLVIVLVQVDPLMSQLDSVKTIFSTATETLVCNCWEEKKPGGFETVSSLIDGLHQFHTGDVKPHSQSNQISIEGKSMQIELTTNTQGYLWELLIT
ncbi:MAG: hypothetical protein HYZ56_01790, partial [Nitrosopumilales archaeon]|nr:hypothetical protein [Nitrosopumilales archaeon]